MGGDPAHSDGLVAALRCELAGGVEEPVPGRGLRPGERANDDFGAGGLREHAAILARNFTVV